MRKCIIIILFFVAILIHFPELRSIDFQIEKIDEFSITSSRNHGLFWNHSIIEDHPYLFALSDYGLEVYMIELDGSLTLITRKPITNSYTMVKIGDYIYVGTKKNHYNPFNAMVIKIDVTNPHEPFIAQTRELAGDVRAVEGIYNFNDFLLINTWTSPISFCHPILDLELDIIVGSVEFDGLLRSYLGNNRVLVEYDAYSYYIYDLSIFEDINVIGSGNISQEHTIYQTFYYSTYQDSVLIVGGQREMSFWNISNPAEWQLLHNIGYIQDPLLVNYGWAYHIIENYLFYLHNYSLIVIDLNNYSYHQILELEPLPYAWGLDAAFWENHVYVTTPDSGIHRYSHNEGVFTRIEIIGDNYSNTRADINGNYLFISGNYSTNGTVIYDVSDPYQIEEINRIKENTPHLFNMVSNDLLVLREFTSLNDFASEVEVIDVSDPLDPYLRNNIDLSNWSQQYFWPTFDTEDPGYLYGFLCNDMKLVKFDVNEPGEALLVFEYDLPYSSNFSYQIREGILYYLVRHGNTNWYTLQIHSGLLENEPFFHGTINYVGNFHISPQLVLFDDYLAIFLWAGHYANIDGLNLKTLLYHLSPDPMNPEYAFEIEMPGPPLIVSDLLFQSPAPTVYVFDVHSNISGVIEPFDSFFNNGWPVRMLPQEVNSINYLYCISYSSIGVYEYSYETAADDDLILPGIETQLLQNYPNPFNPETRIDFYLERGEQVRLEIYNIKGQRVAVLIDEELPQGEHSIVWQAQTTGRKDLSSGVYLYRLQAGEYTRTKKMLYLK